MTRPVVPKTLVLAAALFLAALSLAAGDPGLKAHHSAAAPYQGEVAKRWQTVEKMTKSLRGANHPVVAWMLERGKEVHADRQKRCDASEVAVGGGRADCVMATGSTCLVIDHKLQLEATDDRARMAEDLDRVVAAIAERLPADEVFSEQAVKRAVTQALLDHENLRAIESSGLARLAKSGVSQSLVASLVFEAVKFLL